MDGESVVLRERAVKLIQEKYLLRIARKIFELKRLAKTLSLRTLFFQSLEEGYAGCELAEDPLIGAIPSETQREIEEIFELRIEEEKMTGLVMVRFHLFSLNLWPTREFMIEAVPTMRSEYLIHKRLESIRSD